MTTYPPAPQQYQTNLALDYTHSQVAYVGYEGSIFNISGPLAPVLGAQSGVVLKTIAHLDPGFKHLDNKGARQDGTTWFDTIYDPAEINMVVELGGTDPASTRKVIGDWFGAWDPKQLGKLCWFSPERGEWWCNVRMSKPVQDQFQLDWYQARGTTFTWQCRNDNAFWQSVDSVDTFTLTNSQVLSIAGATGGTFVLSAQGLPGTPASAPIPFNATAADVQAAVAGIAGMPGTGGSGGGQLQPAQSVVVQPQGGSNSLFNILLQGAAALLSIPIVLALDITALVGTAVEGVIQAVSSILNPGSTHTGTPAGPTSSGHITLTNTGDQPGWPRYLCYGPGTFVIGDGGNASNSVTFGPLLDGQIALLSTLPRLPAVTDLSPAQSTAGNNAQTNNLITTLINFVTNNNVPPLLAEFESLFGITPPQGPLYSLLSGRFTTPLPPMSESVGPVPSSIPVSIQGGSATSKIVAAVTPMRRWPE